MMNTTQIETAIDAAITFETSRQIAEIEVTYRWDAWGYKGPYKFVGFEVSKFQAAPGEPVRAGSSCDVCGTSIMNVFKIRDAHGKEFKIGCDCVEHLGDVKLTTAVQRKARAMATEKRHASADARIERARELLASSEATRLQLEQNFHSKRERGPFFAKLTQLDEVEWLMQHAGRNGKVAASKMIEAAAKIARVA